MKHYLFSLLLFSAISLNAQITFQKGYFINNANEKTDCLIKNVDWKNNPTEFEYKLSIDEKESKTTDITSVTEFGIDNESKYKRFEVDIEKSSDNLYDLSSLSNDKNPIYQKQTLFLKVLVEGSASLYLYNESNLYKYFYQTKTIPITQLICIKYNSSDKNADNVSSYSNSLKTNNLFRQQLYNDVKSENITDIEFETIGYNRNSLVKHFTKYNSNNGGSTSNYIAKTEKDIVNIKITAGVTTNKITVGQNTEVSNKLGYSLGAEFEYVLSFNKNKWGIFINPTYQKYSTTTNGDYNAEINYSSFEIPLGLRYYMFLNNNSKLFVNIFDSLNFAMSNSEIVFDNDSVNAIEIEPRNNFGLGFGYCYKNTFSIELRTNINKKIVGNYFEWSGMFGSSGIQLSYKVF